jgi:hypothetical protein
MRRTLKNIDERRLPPRLGPVANGAIFLGVQIRIGNRRAHAVPLNSGFPAFTGTRRKSAKVRRLGVNAPE